MVNCCVPECTNYSTKTKDVSYHKIPKDLQIQKAWISRLRRANLPPLKNCYVCSEHFEDGCFESDLMEQLIGEKRKRRLKADAIPSIFNFSTIPSKRRATTENRIRRQRQKETLDNLLTPTTHALDEMVEESDMEVSFDETPSNKRDFGVQCCLDEKLSIRKSTSTQTENVDVSVETSDACIQVEGNSTFEQLNSILHDHPYSYTAPSVPMSVSPQKSCKNDVSPQKSAKSCGSFPLSDEEVNLFSSDEEDEYIISSQETNSSTDKESEPEYHFDTYIKEPKYLVFAACLGELFRFCINCGSIVTDTNITCTGSMVTVKTICMKGHNCLWNSQPLINRAPVGNLLIC
ncbi:uncharacterized protein LOC116292014, partial [Actinia tenebrosa]|uniref:Uncharacterized protein LOC116292014 n=1 Tax=Actinia tenebrosa TaxID=6105 RepID=A0A6P8HR06_ACTTE